MTRAHGFPRQILRNSAVQFPKFRGSQWKIVQIQRPVAAFHWRVNWAYTDSGPVAEGYNTNLVLQNIILRFLCRKAVIQVKLKIDQHLAKLRTRILTNFVDSRDSLSESSINKRKCDDADRRWLEWISGKDGALEYGAQLLQQQRVYCSGECSAKCDDDAAYPRIR